MNPVGNTNDIQTELIETLKAWQKVEKDSIAMARETQRKSRNALVRLVMEILAHDSVLHHRVQQFLLDNIEKSSLTLQPEELDTVWEMIEKHIEFEKKILELANKAQSATELKVPSFLLNYLLKDEEKHDALLERLEEIKVNMHPYA